MNPIDRMIDRSKERLQELFLWLEKNEKALHGTTTWEKRFIEARDTMNVLKELEHEMTPVLKPRLRIQRTVHPPVRVSYNELFQRPEAIAIRS